MVDDEKLFDMLYSLDEEDEMVVTVLGAKENTFTYTKDYCLVIIIGSVFTMGNYVIGQLLRSEGSTFYSMVGMIVGTVANIILDQIFIFAFRLEIKGAAIATVLRNAVGMLICLWFYFKKKTILRPSTKLLILDMRIIKEIMEVGIPHTLEQFFTTAAMIENNNLATTHGELTVAVMGVANKIMSFGTYVYQGMAAGCQPLMGYNYDAKNYTRMKALVRSGTAVTTIIELFIMMIFGLVASYLIGVLWNLRK